MEQKKDELTEETKKKREELVDPILQLFGAHDGGVGFCSFYHLFLPELIEKSQTNSALAARLAEIERFSKLCKRILETNI